MKTTCKFHMVGLIATLLLVAATATAGLPVQIERTWAPVGDDLGLENHWALGYSALDQYGSPSKNLEDWQLGEDHSFSGLFAYDNLFGAERHITLRGYGTNADGQDFTGSFLLKANCVGKRTLTVRHRGFNYFGDATSEMRSQSFAAGPAPEALADADGMAWCRNDVDLDVRVNERIDLNVGATRSTRVGSKSSLLRADTGAAQPGRKTYDTELTEFRWGGALALGPVATGLKMSYRTAEGRRDLTNAAGTHVVDDDQKVFTTAVNATYDFDADTRVLGGFVGSKLENDATEIVDAISYAPTTEATTKSGHLGLIRQLGQTTTLNASVKLRKQAVSGENRIGGATQQYDDRERTSQDYRIGLRHTGIAKTKLEAFYRYRATDLDAVTTAYTDQVSFGATTAEGGDFQTSATEKKRQEFGFKGRYRFGPKALLKARLNWNAEEVTQTETWDTVTDDAWLFWMGDRKVNNLRGELALRTRPAKKLSMDLGYQMADRNFELDGADVSETSWTTQRGFAAANWRAHERLTLHGNVSLGIDKSELIDGPTESATLGTLTYEGTTWRFAPGAVLQVSKKLQLEAHYEGVRFEDDGDNAGGLTKLSTDYDRTTLRARWRLMEKTSLALSYRRLEFDENRWDDTINDIYTMSVSGTF